MVLDSCDGAEHCTTSGIRASITSYNSQIFSKSMQSSTAESFNILTWQQILADEHGLSFSAYIPKAPTMQTLNPLSSGPLTSLKATDIASLGSLGWTIKPPVSETESREEELFRLVIESSTINERVKTLLTEGAKVAPEESEQ